MRGLLTAACVTGLWMLLGAFLAGIVLPTLPDTSDGVGVRNVCHDQLHEVKVKLLVPLFFASIGIHCKVHSRAFLGPMGRTLIWPRIVYPIAVAFAKLMVGRYHTVGLPS
ncbi:hypothetical protein CALCODRAFT_507159 [Calocera cornea HHB12733]|uniref:Uncharacterized protein n=1 Tax=Calocera cornea HHB12733 TaxID=1353952 RepID=A0A165I0Z2_9BASI|nr:hypothetical protein CALCODRAFT_507159 [Calocera cornea HHB12733]